MKTFYDTRSKIVHGSKKTSEPALGLLEAADRICLMLCLTIAANHSLWEKHEQIQLWCNDQKWGYPAAALKSVVPVDYLDRAIRLGSP